MTVRRDAGFTLIELLVVVGVIGIIAAIAVPNLVRGRLAGNEASAIASLRVINSAQVGYSMGCAKGLYAPTLTALSTPPTGGQPFLSRDLRPITGATVNKSGYTVRIQGTGAAVAGAAIACNAVGANALRGAYFASAAPISPSTGRRFFGTSAAQTIFQHTSAITAINAAGRPTPAAAKAIQ